MPTAPRSWTVLVLCGLFLTAAATPEGAPGGDLPHPVMFVTQVPIPADFATIGSVFANHQADLQSAGRGGDLYIRYPNGSLRNLTAEAGYGNTGFQGAGGIAVRDPAVHWDGTKAVFSMVIGAPTQQFQVNEYRWQLYQVTGLGMGQTAVITKVPHQPADYNNVSPVYASDDRILFTSDRPRDGSPHLYPQLDEYETTPTNTGLWSLDPISGELYLLEHSPSGAFTPLVDSFGRLLFTRWDHLQRDQQADSDVLDGDIYGTFNFASERADAARLNDRTEVFPEPRPARTDLLGGTNLEGHTINHFFPWQIRQDGRGEEILNHLGRHELHDYFNRSINDDPNLDEFIAEVSGRTNPNSVLNLLQLEEHPAQPGQYVAVDAPEFFTHASGMLVSLTAPPSQNPDLVTITYLTHPDTAGFVPDGETPPATHSGHYREPLYLADGTLIAAHTVETHQAVNLGTRPNPMPNYHFRLKRIVPGGGGYRVAGTALTAGITKTISYWDPDVLVSYSGQLWELNPVEVRPRTRPIEPPAVLPGPEQQAFTTAGVDVATFQENLRQRGLALITVRNVTRRDAADRQQPFNLRVPGGVQTVGAAGTLYDVAHLQLFQADQIRGIGGVVDPRAGRRVLAQVQHDRQATNPPNPTGPAGSVLVAADGSAAALVPARRAVSWQLSAPNGTPVVRERYWLSFQPGEIRTCDGCHGINTTNQAGGPPAANSPQALLQLLQQWQQSQQSGFVFIDRFEEGDLSAWSATSP